MARARASIGAVRSMTAQSPALPSDDEFSQMQWRSELDLESGSVKTGRPDRETLNGHSLAIGASPLAPCPSPKQRRASIDARSGSRPRTGAGGGAAARPAFPIGSPMAWSRLEGHGLEPARPLVPGVHPAA